MNSEEAQRTATAGKVAVAPGEALEQTLRGVGARRVLVYAKCPVTGAHHCLGHLKRVRGPFHTMPLTILYKRSLGRGRGFGTIAESSLVPTGVYLRVRELLKKYVGFASGVKGFGKLDARCGCGSVMSPLLEKVRLRDRRVRFHLSFSCANCRRVERPWVRYYLARYSWLVRRASSVRALSAGGLRCRRCGERAMREFRRRPEAPASGMGYRCHPLRCSRCGFVIDPPRFASTEDGEVTEL